MTDIDDTSLTAQAIAIFENDRYATATTGIELTHVGQHEARCRVKLGPRHLNAMGGVMGGVLFTLADLAFAAAANSDEIAAGSPLRWVSLVSTITYLGNKRDDYVEAQARCVKQGHSSCTYSITITSSDGQPLAIVTTTGAKTHSS